MSLPSDLTKILLRSLGFDALNEMQQSVVEAARHSPELVLIAPTGSGKTIAFLLPLLADLRQAAEGSQALIVTPTRELAQQIGRVWRQMNTGLPVSLCYGGHDRQAEDRSLAAMPRLIIGTPGRLGDHFHRGNIDPALIVTLVLDEFDKSLELGFEQEMAQILTQLHSLRRRVLCSATEAVRIPDFTGMKHPRRVDFSEGAHNEKLRLQLIRLADKDKADGLFRLLCMLGTKRSIVFVNHRQAVERVQSLLAENGIDAAAYHGALEQDARELALARLRNGSVHTLIATDLAARGLDLPALDAVIHYHLPGSEAAFIHRNGRTARMGAEGAAFVLLGPEEKEPDFMEAPGIVPTVPDSLEASAPLPSPWTTLRIAAGKKDKISKADVLGFLTQAASLKKDEVGIIEVMDNYCLAAIPRQRMSQVLRAGKAAPLKGRKRLMGPAR